MSAVVTMLDGKVRQLDRPRGADEVVSPTDAEDTTKLARLLTRLLAEVGALRRRFAPRRLTFRNIEATGDYDAPQTVVLTHLFGGQVEWEIVNVRDVVATTLSVDFNPVHIMFAQESANEASQLTLLVYFTGTVAIRVEEAG